MRLETLRENERKTIVREIHDEFGQSLTALQYHICWLRQNMATAAKEQLHTQLGTMESLVENGLEKIQKISAHIRPDILDDLGLAAAIEWQAKELQQLSGITFHCELKAETYPALPQETAIAVFRIFQESLTNILRHSGATQAEISLDRRDNRLCLRIADNGRGITDDALSSPSSYGIRGMMERIHSCPEGSLEIKRGTPNGTVTELSLRCTEPVGVTAVAPHEAAP
jgi:signal transduction histidine kinase